jgi:hypothetical protein
MDKSGVPQPDRRGRVRFPITVYVDGIEFDPDVQYTTVTRTSYDLELNEHDMQKLYEGLKARLDSHLPKAIRIRITGRLVS